MNSVLSFYEETAPDSEGRYLSDILSSSNEFLEKTHDYIQWLFPNKEISFFNPDAPLLTEEIIKEFKTRSELQVAIKRSLNRMIAFYHMDAAHPWWVTKNNHNYLRITRILHTLRAFDMDHELIDFFGRLLVIFDNNRDIISDTTFDYWTDAFYGDTE